MPLYIRDDSVDALAVKVQRLTGARTKTEAVRQALEHELARVDTAEKPSLRERIAKIQDEVRALGEPDPDFDMKKFTDEGWDGM